MTTDQFLAFAILVAALALFVWGRFRYDLVAVAALLASVVAGLVPAESAFAGFAHPAVVTVAAVLVISRALQNAGIVDLLLRPLRLLQGRPQTQITAQTGLVAALSGLMNNVGALALMLPVAVRSAWREGYPPARSLMLLAFASLLGGLVTLIGTPPNLIVSAFRAEATGAPFAMFDFAPVGGVVALFGVVFLVTVGWRLIPRDRRSGAAEAAFQLDDYLMEAAVPDGAKAVDRTVGELEQFADDGRIVGIVRGRSRRLVPAATEPVRAGDVLVLEGDPDSLQTLIERAGLTLTTHGELDKAAVSSGEVAVAEAIVKPGSPLVRRSPRAVHMRRQHNVNLLGIARHGRRARVRLRDVRIQVGDVLLLQGTARDLEEALAGLGCIPLAERDLGVGRPRRLLLAGGTFLAAVGAVLAGWLPVQIAFVAAAALLVLTRVVRPDEMYSAIDWPVIVLLGALIPVGTALETTGGTRLIAQGILALGRDLPVAWVLVLLMVGTMLLSDVINNNATAVLMAPVALDLAHELEASPDPFLMAVALSASCAFLTPIGHQSNTLVLEPGGYRFGDYWRVGLPLEVVIVAVGVPMLLLVWPP